MKAQDRRLPAWRYIVFIAGNVLILFAALHGVRMAAAFPVAPEGHWIESMVVAAVVNAITLPFHIRKFGPVWLWFAPAYWERPVHRLWSALRRRFVRIRPT